MSKERRAEIAAAMITTSLRAELSKRDERQARADAEGNEGRYCRADRRAEIVGVQAKLLAGERVERMVGIGDEFLGDVRASSIKAARRVDQSELLGLFLRVALQLVGLCAI